MVLTYRRTGGLFMLLTLGVAALAATLLAVVAAGILLIGAASVAAVALLGRAVLPRRWRHHTIPAVARWPRETIDATVVNATSSPAASSSETLDLARVDEDTT